MTFLLARSNIDREQFQQWMLKECAPAILNQAAVERLVINLVEVPPAQRAYTPPTDQISEDGRLAHDIVMETTVPSVDAFRALIGPSAKDQRLNEWASECFSYRVTERVELDRKRNSIGRSPGIKFMSRLMFHADMPDSAARRSWDLHVKLALKVHVGACKYVRNWIEEPLTPNAPPTRGVPELHFASDADALERFFDSPRGRDEVLQDTSHFIAGGPRLYTREYVLR
jgi:hypothetical protein